LYFDCILKYRLKIQNNPYHLNNKITSMRKRHHFLWLCLLLAIAQTTLAQPVVSPANLEFCMGETPKITISGCHHYTSSPGGIAGIAAIINTGTATVYTSTSVTYNITGYNEDGTVCGKVDLPVTVNPIPAVSINTSTTAICRYGPGSNNAILTVNNPNPAHIYTWMPATGLSATTGTSVTATPNTDTNYYVIWTDPATGCKTESNRIIIYSGTYPEVTSISTQTVNLCRLATSPIITYTSTGTMIGGGGVCGGNLTPSETPTGGYFAITSPNETFGPSQCAGATKTYIYTLVGVGPTGCVGPTTEITVNVSPNISPTITPSATGEVCAGAPLTLTASNIAGATYLWSPAATLDATTNRVVTATPLANTTYNVAVTSGYCTVNKKINVVTKSCGLPVTFTSFTGQNTNNQNLLNWQTSEEMQNEGFEIERSSNAKSFERIGFVKGATESRDLQHYTFSDTQPFVGTNYYRLKQLDSDGRFSYSRIIAVLPEADESFLVVYPNPATDQVTVLSRTGTIKAAQLLTTTGLLLSDKQVTDGHALFSMSHLPAGIYLMVVAIDDYYVTQKIIKQ
jgi:hypothetical protein